MLTSGALCCLKLFHIVFLCLRLLTSLLTLRTTYKYIAFTYKPLIVFSSTVKRNSSSQPFNVELQRIFVILVQGFDVHSIYVLKCVTSACVWDVQCTSCMNAWIIVDNWTDDAVLGSETCSQTLDWKELLSTVYIVIWCIYICMCIYINLHVFSYKCKNKNNYMF